jgi:RimJ/RimL family protein N-acetyltransferase
MRAPEVLETLRLRLRVPRLEDAKVIFDSYARDPVVTRYLTWLPHQSVETTEKFIVDCIEHWGKASAFPYVITRRSDDRLLGMIDLRPNQHGANMGYVLAKEHWRQGNMTEAACCLVDYALSQSSIYRIQAFCDVDNVASARTLEKVGMLREGTLRRYIIHPGVSMEPRDCFMYSITK